MRERRKTLAAVLECLDRLNWPAEADLLLPRNLAADFDRDLAEAAPAEQAFWRARFPRGRRRADFDGLVLAVHDHTRRCTFVV